MTRFTVRIILVAQTQATLMQESQYTRSTGSGFNISSTYVLKSGIVCSFPVDVVPHYVVRGRFSGPIVRIHVTGLPALNEG